MTTETIREYLKYRSLSIEELNKEFDSLTQAMDRQKQYITSEVTNMDDYQDAMDYLEYLTIKQNEIASHLAYREHDQEEMDRYAEEYRKTGCVVS